MISPTARDMAAIWNRREETGDVEFVLAASANARVSAHRVILASFSHYFRDLFATYVSLPGVRSFSDKKDGYSFSTLDRKIHKNCKSSSIILVKSTSKSFFTSFTQTPLTWITLRGFRNQEQR